MLRVEKINRSKEGTEVQLQPMLAPRFAAVVETGDVTQGEVIRCDAKQRYMGHDDKGNQTHVIVLQCGKRVLLLREVQF
jgi:hypothetical protein